MPTYSPPDIIKVTIPCFFKDQNSRHLLRKTELVTCAIYAGVFILLMKTLKILINLN